MCGRGCGCLGSLCGCSRCMGLRWRIWMWRRRSPLASEAPHAQMPPSRGRPVACVLFRSPTACRCCLRRVTGPRWVRRMPDGGDWRAACWRKPFAILAFLRHSLLRGSVPRSGSNISRSVMRCVRLSSLTILTRCPLSNLTRGDAGSAICTHSRDGGWSPSASETSSAVVGARTRTRRDFSRTGAMANAVAWRR